MKRYPRKVFFIFLREIMTREEEIWEDAKHEGKEEGKLETEARLLPMIEAKDNQLS